MVEEVDVEVGIELVVVVTDAEFRPPAWQEHAAMAATASRMALRSPMRLRRYPPVAGSPDVDARAWSESVGFVKVAESRWTLDACVTLAHDADSVVRWWFHPMRTTEARVRLERMVPADFYWRSDDTSTVRIREFGWSVPGSHTVQHRREVYLAPGQMPARQEDGYVVVGRDLSVVVYVNGRQVTTECHHTTAFRPVAVGMTRLTSVHEHLKKGVPWWERYLPPVTERRTYRREFARLAELCETDIGLGLHNPAG